MFLCLLGILSQVASKYIPRIPQNATFFALKVSSVRKNAKMENCNPFLFNLTLVKRLRDEKHNCGVQILQKTVSSRQPVVFDTFLRCCFDTFCSTVQIQFKKSKTNYMIIKKWNLNPKVKPHDSNQINQCKSNQSVNQSNQSINPINQSKQTNQGNQINQPINPSINHSIH